MMVEWLSEVSRLLFGSLVYCLVSVGVLECIYEGLYDGVSIVFPVVPASHDFGALFGCL